MRRLFLFAAVLGLTLAACDRGKPDEAATEAADPSGIKGAHRDAAGKPAPAVELKDAEDEPATLADLKGRPLLVNLWASWCGPCVKELPTLQRLAERPGAPRVIAVSQDMAPRGSVDAFLDKHKLSIEAWHDPEMALSSALDAQVLPTTILYDAQGREGWRYVGDLDWTGEEAAKLLAEAR